MLSVMLRRMCTAGNQSPGRKRVSGEYLRRRIWGQLLTFVGNRSLGVTLAQAFPSCCIKLRTAKAEHRQML